MHAANTRFVMVAYSARAFFWLPSFDFFLEHWETIPVLFQIYFINFQILIPKKETFPSIKDSIDIWNYELRCLTKIGMVIFSELKLWLWKFQTTGQYINWELTLFTKGFLACVAVHKVKVKEMDHCPLNTKFLKKKIIIQKPW